MQMQNRTRPTYICWLLLCLSFSVECRPCSLHHRFSTIQQRRRLAQDLPCDPLVSACPSTAASGQSSVQVIQGGILVTGCSILDNSTVLSGTTVLPGLYTIAGSKRGCCTVCARRDGCNAWNFCMHPDGCSVPDRLNVSAFAEAPEDVSRVPYKGCILLSKRPASSSSELLEDDSDFSSGQMSRMFMPSISGYSTFPSRNISASYDFTCGYSPTKDRCEIYGSASEISDICSADPRCKGFVFLPSISGDSSQNLGILKRGPTGGGLIEEDDLIQDPQSNVYLLTEQGLVAKSPVESSSGSSSNTVLWIVLPTIAGVLIIAMVAIMVTFACMARTQTKALHREEVVDEVEVEVVDEVEDEVVEDEDEVVEVVEVEDEVEVEVEEDEEVEVVVEEDRHHPVVPTLDDDGNAHAIETSRD